MQNIGTGFAINALQILIQNASCWYQHLALIENQFTTKNDKNEVEMFDHKWFNIWSIMQSAGTTRYCL